MGAVILQMVKQNDEKHEAGHKRLREDYRTLENEYDRLHTQVTDLQSTISNVSRTLDRLGQDPIDVGKIVFNPRMVLAIVGLVVTIVTGNWIVNLPVRDSLSGMQTSLGTMKTQMDSRGVLEDERHANMTKMIEELKKAQALAQIDISNIQKEQRR